MRGNHQTLPGVAVSLVRRAVTYRESRPCPDRRRKEPHSRRRALGSAQLLTFHRLGFTPNIGVSVYVSTHIHANAHQHRPSRPPATVSGHFSVPP